MKDFVNLLDPSLINSKKVVVIGAGNLEVPLLIDSFFSPKSIDAVDTEIWRDNFHDLKQKAASTKVKINLYPLADLTVKELISTGATPWDIIFCDIYLEAYENPLELIEGMTLFTTNTLLLYTHTGIDSQLPIMVSRMITNRSDHTGIYWQISEKFIDSHLKYIGFYKAFDLVELQRTGANIPLNWFIFLKNTYRTICFKTSDFLSKNFNASLYKILDLLCLRRANTPASVELVKVFKKPKPYCKLWMKL